MTNDLSSSQQDFFNQGLEKELFEVKDGRIKYFHQGKSYNFNDSEEPIRATTYSKLVFRWGYSPENIDFEIIPPRREPKLPADIVVYEEKSNDVYIVVECKSSYENQDEFQEKLTEASRQGVGNSNLLDATWLYLAIGDSDLFFLVEDCSNFQSLSQFKRSELPAHYGESVKYRFIKGKENPSEVNFKTLRKKFSRCHDIIWEGGKRDPAVAFDEMSKLMFSKIYDERFTKKGKRYRFQIGTNETPYEVSERIRNSYSLAREKEPTVFKDKIEITDRIIFEVVKVLQGVSLTKTDLDAKGQAFEEFLGKVFKKELGQYFTPREVIQFMVDFVDPGYNDLIMDPACGSGGFLLYSIKHAADKARRELNEKDADRFIWDFSHNNVFGIEINKRIARVAMMDMVINEDGHSNIECNDALTKFDKFDSKKDIRKEKYDFVLTNPPFGDRERRKTILDQYRLGKKDKDRPSQKKDILFIERGIQLLNEKGIMGIISPDGILNNSSHYEMREFLKRKTNILGVISLPEQTFKPYNGADETSILFVQKTDESTDKPIFMTKVNHVGYDSTGNPDKNDLPFLSKKYEEFQENSEKFDNVKKDGEIIAYSLERDLLQNRLDYPYYEPSILRVIEDIEESDYKVTNLEELVDSIDTGKTFDRKEYDESGEVFNIKVTNLEDDRIAWDSRSNYGTFTNKDTYDRNESVRVKEGDILLTCSSHNKEYIARNVAIVNELPDEFNGKVIASGEIMIIRPDTSKIEPEYLSYYLRSEKGQVQIQRILTGQSAHLYPNDMKKLFRVIVPSQKDEQKSIVSTIKDKIEKKQKYLSKTQKLEEEIVQHYEKFPESSK